MPSGIEMVSEMASEYLIVQCRSPSQLEWQSNDWSCHLCMLGYGVETKTVFSIFVKSANDAKMSKFLRNFVSRKFSFPRKFSRKWVRFCDKHLQNDKFKRKFDLFSACPLLLTDLFWSNIRIWKLRSAWWTVLFVLKPHPDLTIYGQYSCPICFEAPFGEDNTIEKCMPITVVRFVLKHHPDLTS
jgi:hypothetical protein